MSKVYVVNKGGHDYREAHEWGDLVFVTQGIMNIFNLDRCRKEIEENLENFTEQDYLLYAGNVVLCAIATAVLLKKYEEINVLLYQAKEKRYIPRRIRR